MKRTTDFIHSLANLTLDIPKNRIFMEKCIQSIEWKETLSPEEKKELENLKLMLHIPSQDE